MVTFHRSLSSSPNISGAYVGIKPGETVLRSYLANAKNGEQQDDRPCDEPL
jgi:hypothetical protein